MKRGLVLFIISLLLASLIINLVSADLSDQIVPLGKQIEATAEQGSKTIQTVETKWDYLSKEWKKILLENNFVSGFDSFFTKISIVFRIIFGQPYSLSLTLLVIIILWFYFFFKLGEIVSSFTSFSNSTSWVIALTLTLILAQLQILKAITEFFGWLIISQDSTWWRVLIIWIIFIGMILIYYLSSKAATATKKQKEELEKEQESLDRRILHTIAGAFKNMFRKS